MIDWRLILDRPTAWQKQIGWTRQRDSPSSEAHFLLAMVRSILQRSCETTAPRCGADPFSHDSLWLTCDTSCDSVHNYDPDNSHLQVNADADNARQALQLWLWSYPMIHIRTWHLKMTSTTRKSILSLIWHATRMLLLPAHILHDNLSLIRRHWWRWAWGDCRILPRNIVERREYLDEYLLYWSLSVYV